ncbi:MAG: TonB-dependent receptor [Porticoccaceae bacterium]|jgi:iron complex outermembrane receptor protein|nr:TonB-dependent receptor [Porticoccaceae bacterium]
MIIKNFKISAITAAVIAGSAMLPSTALFAQEMVEEIITLGARAKARSATDSVAPVDVINASELANQGDVDITNLLRNSVPSYYVSDQPISDAGTMVRPQGLRGMAADHTLVLVNGKRRHRSSVILWAAGGISDGAQGPDTSVFPTAAIKTVDVLRDGAASQYGSDALAGVINFNLKDASEGGSISVKAGQYGEGDGDMQYVSGNFGLPLGANGFVNTTFEIGSLGDTNRAVQRADAAGLVADGYTNVPNPAMIWGRPKVDDDMKLFVNFGADLGNNTEMYGYANSTTKKIDGGFYFRNPTNRGGVYGNGSTLLIGDMDGIGVGTDCPVVTLDGNTPDPVAMAIVAADPNCFSFQETIPGGFTPRFGGTMTDQAMLFGLRGEMANGVGWDVSSYYGKNEADFFINNTVNASMGPNSPRDFDPGLYRQVETSLNADFTYAMSDAVSLAFGAEYRNEEFTIGAGDSASSTAGVLANQGFSLSSNGFPGFAKAISGVFDRSNTAVYVEADWQASDDLVVVGALRFEDFDDFGTTTNYKLGANYNITDTTGVRGTFSTGFKAPTPGQSNASNISTTIDNATGKLVNKGVIPATSPVALVYGGKQLQPEDSENMTFGIYTTVGEFEITLDYFSIDVDDRLNFSKDVNLSAADIAQLIADNVPGAGDMSKFRFYTNDFDTTTDGFDLVVSTSTDWMGGTTDWNLAYNQTNTDVTNRGVTIDDEREKRIEQMTPDTRWNLSANHMMGDWRMLARISYYGDWYDSGEGFVYPGENVVDLELAYNINDNSSVMVGGNNVLDEAGDTLHNINSYGNLYSTQAPMGFSGAFWYAKYSYNF